jgi:mono/diheme cytochrome c family protein
MKSNLKISAVISLIALSIGLLISCKKEAPPASEALFQQGRLTYISRCAVCHNANPHEPGSVGPDVWGSSRELIEARVMRAEYPSNYKPKRETHLMVALPDVSSQIDAIYAFLNDKH